MLTLFWPFQTIWNLKLSSYANHASRHRASLLFKISGSTAENIHRFSSQNAGIGILCHRSVFTFKELVYPPAPFSMFSNCEPKVPSSGSAASYVQRWALCSNRPANVKVSVKWEEVVERSETDTLPLPLLSCEFWMFVKENPDRKNKKLEQFSAIALLKLR